MRTLYLGSLGRLVIFLCAATVAHAHANIGGQAHASSSSVPASGSAGEARGRRLRGEGRTPQRSAGIDTKYPLKHGRKCGVDSVTPQEYNLVQSAIQNNWLLRNSVRGSQA